MDDILTLMVEAVIISSAMRRAKYKILEDGTYFGWIEDLPGVWSNGSSLSLCQQELQSVIEDWLLLGLKLGHHITPLGGMDLNIPVKAHYDLK